MSDQGVASTPCVAHVRVAERDDVDGCAEALASAYVDDAWIAWLVAVERRKQRVKALQSSLLAVVGIPHGEVWLAENERGAVVGAAFWLPADSRVPAEAWAEVAAAETELMGDRHPYAKVAADATRHLRPTQPHHLLAALGVVATERGRGTGSALLMPTLHRARRERVDVYLETSTADNVRFYGRLGFEVIDCVDLPDGGPPVWAMLRTPLSPLPGHDTPVSGFEGVTPPTV